MVSSSPTATTATFCATPTSCCGHSLSLHCSHHSFVICLPPHAGIGGNEMADSGAMRGTMLSLEGEGVYRDEASVLIANRTLDGAPGFWVMTPLAQADGTELWVARGFLNRGLVEQGDPSTWAAGDAPVSVVGLLAASAADGAFAGGAAPGGDRPAEASRPDTALLAGPDGADLGVYLQAESDASPALVAIPPPPLDGGPHISYAVQWFVFSLIAIIGYPLVLRRVARDRAGRQSSAATLGDDEPVRA